MPIMFLQKKRKTERKASIALRRSGAPFRAGSPHDGLQNPQQALPEQGPPVGTAGGLESQAAHRHTLRAALPAPAPAASLLSKPWAMAPTSAWHVLQLAVT